LDGYAAGIVLVPPQLGRGGVDRFAEASAAHALVHDEGGTLTITPLATALEKRETEVDRADPKTLWSLATSGTTGNPKLYAHCFSSLSSAAVHANPRSAEFVWGLVYDAHRFAGLQVLLQSLLAGCPLSVPNSFADIEAAVATFKAHGVNALSATPSMWRRILMTQGATDLALRQVTLGGEIADQAILSALRIAFPRARVVHIYACTEAGVAFTVKDGAAGFPRHYLQSAPGKADVRVSDDGFLLLRPHSTPPRRLGDGSACNAFNPDGFIRTEDRVEVIGDRVYFLGRAAGAINVGGLKVFPEEVEQVLLAHPAVLAAKVFGKRSSLTGQLVVAEISASEIARPNLAKEIRDFCATKLPAYKVPAFVTLVPTIAISSAGKLERTPIK